MNCQICPLVKNTTKIQSTSNNKTYTITQNLDCNSTSAIYAITCKKCFIQYIGQTGNSIRDRMYGHFADIRSANQHKPVSRHFTSQCNSQSITSQSNSTHNLSITILSKTSNNVNIRLRTEEAFIQFLKTIHPHGLYQKYG